MRFSVFYLASKGFLVQRYLFVGVFLVLFLALRPCHPQTTTSSAGSSKTSEVSVVDIIPQSLSGETDDDTEPNVAVNPKKPWEIAVSALTREPLRANKAPIFVSTDGGQSWSARSIVPSPQITCDVTLRFGSCSNVLYLSALRNQIQFQKYTHPELVICKCEEFANARLMDEVFNNRTDIDQPYIAAMTVDSKDHVFVGDKDYNFTLANGQAAIDRSLNSPQGSFTPFNIEFESRGNVDMDSSEVRPAVTADGKVVYVAFNRVTSSSDDNCSWEAGTRTSAVVVVRDDNGGASTPPFSSLGPQSHPGVLAVKTRTFAWNRCLGGDRLGGDLAIAVHPRDRNKVYLVWSDWVCDHTSLHLKYSTDGGKTWSGNKRDIPDAKNPGLAVDAQGVVGFLYQQVVKTSGGYTWRTQFERTTDDFKTPEKPLALAEFPVPRPSLYKSCCYDILLGDYLNLVSVDNDFYGVFSSNNKPDLSQFPCGVKFLRRTDFQSKKLLDQQGHNVNPSIDPFFFKVTD